MRYWHRQQTNTGKVIGAGILGIVIGALAGIFMAPKSGQENRENFSNWMQSMNEDLSERLHDARDMTQEKYNRLVDRISDRYRRARKIKDTELNDFIDELKMRWDRIKDQWQQE